MASRILIVDDEPEAGRILSLQLSLHGYNTEIASNGFEALKRVEEDAPDLVLLDVMLPKMDGLTVCRRIRATDHAAALPVILISAKSDPESVAMGKAAGANDYLFKPFDFEDVLRVVRAALAGSGNDA